MPDPMPPKHDEPKGPPPPPPMPGIPPHILHELMELKEKVGILEGKMEIIINSKCHCCDCKAEK